MVEESMPTIFERIEEAYHEHAMRTYQAVVRPTDIGRLLKKFPELFDEEIESINTYFSDEGTLVGLAVKYRDN